MAVVLCLFSLVAKLRIRSRSHPKIGICSAEKPKRSEDARLMPVGDGRILFSDFNGHLFLLEKTGVYTEILNTTTVQTNLADFEWIPEKQMLIIPGLYSNRLGAYKLMK
jgi:hypothetical protein